MPTDTKKRTENASLKGSDSSAARWLSGDSRITMPAKKAPSAKDTPKSAAEPYAIPTAAAITLSVNNSRELDTATKPSNQGNTRRPITSMMATKMTILPRAITRTVSTLLPVSSSTNPPMPPPSVPASGGSRTSTSTIARSSTISQPTAILPFTVRSKPRCSNALINTTVLATERQSPNTRLAPKLQPHANATPIPSAVATTICTSAPGKAMRFTCSKSLNEKCRPTPNISRITPISAS